MTDQNPHHGKIYLVTGAGRGIGKAVVERLDNLGAKVYALSKNPDNLEKLKEEHPNVNTICVNLSDWNTTRQSLENLEAVDCVINNAAIGIPGNFFNTKPEDIDSMVNVNLKAVINVSQIMAKKMIATGKDGSIVNISSVSARKAGVGPQVISYACIKAAVEMLTKIMAITLGPHKIRLNAVCPSATETDMLLQALEVMKESGMDCVNEFRTVFEQQTPTGQVLLPMNDVVNAILFMASNSAPQITGQILCVDGGLSAV